MAGTVTGSFRPEGWVDAPPAMLFEIGGVLYRIVGAVKEREWGIIDVVYQRCSDGREFYGVCTTVLDCFERGLARWIEQ